MRFTDRKLGMLLLLLLLSGLVHDETVFEEEESNDDAKEGRANDVNVPKSLGIRMNADQRFATATRKTRFSTSCCCGGGAYVVSLTLQRNDSAIIDLSLASWRFSSVSSRTRRSVRR